VSPESCKVGISKQFQLKIRSGLNNKTLSFGTQQVSSNAFECLHA
jgi:hypothetical protein